jgi:hypothetical protein
VAGPALVGVGALPDCSGDATLALGLGVETGVDEDNMFSMAIDMGGTGGSRIKSGTVLTARMVNSKDPGFTLLCWSARVAHAVNVLATCP